MSVGASILASEGARGSRDRRHLKSSHSRTRKPSAQWASQLLTPVSKRIVKPLQRSASLFTSANPEGIFAPVSDRQRRTDTRERNVEASGERVPQRRRLPDRPKAFLESARCILFFLEKEGSDMPNYPAERQEKRSPFDKAKLVFRHDNAALKPPPSP